MLLSTSSEARPQAPVHACTSDTYCIAYAETQRYAIVGGGFAGVATAHYLAATASVARPVVVHLYDLAGLVSKAVRCFAMVRILIMQRHI